VRPAAAPDPDPDGVALAAATAAGVLLGTHAPAPPAWAFALAAATLTLAAACLAGPRRPAPARHPGPARWPPRRRARRGTAAGALVLLTLAAAGAAVAAARAEAVRGGVLLARVGRPGVVAVAGTVAEEPRPLPHQARWVVLSVERVTEGGRTWRTRERAGVVLPLANGPLGVGDRLRLRAGVGRARRADRLGHRPPVTLRHPRVEARSPPASAVLRASEAIRAAARRQALASLPPERAGLLVGMALGDTSLLPRDLDGAFRVAGLSHLVAVSGQDEGQ
jgi:competence protein ComEC